MNLHFRTRRVDLLGYASVDAIPRESGSDFWRRNEMLIRVVLRGRAVLRKRDGRDGPGADFNLPPDIDEELHTRRTPLSTLVRFYRSTEWEAHLDRWVQGGQWYRTPSYQTAAAKLGERAKAEANALVWYDDADPKGEFGRRPSDASLRVELLLPDEHHPVVLEWCRFAAVHPALLPSLTLDDIHFTRHESVALDGHAPTWQGFLDSRWPAVAHDYNLTMRGVRAASNPGRRDRRT
jgi:hypothetical protein